MAELERRVGMSWFLSDDFLERLLAVMGYVLLGYFIIWVTILLPIALWMNWLVVPKL